jgi:hypothetical protein
LRTFLNVAQTAHIGEIRDYLVSHGSSMFVRVVVKLSSILGDELGIEVREGREGCDRHYCPVEDSVADGGFPPAD